MENDLQMLKHVATVRPTTNTLWDGIGTSCSTEFGGGKMITARAVKDRFRLLIAQHKSKTRENLAK